MTGIFNGDDVESVVCGAVGGNNRADSWEVEIPLLDHCSKAPDMLFAQIEIRAKAKIDALMERYPSIEWLAYLIGDKAQPLVVQDLYIPQQDVTGTSVDNIQCPEFNDLSVIGVIHSHHGMGTGFSGTDHAWINQNHNLSIVVAKDGIAGQMRWATPCGGIKIIPVKCRVKYDLEFNKEEFLQQSTPKISQKGYSSPGAIVAGRGIYTYKEGKMVPTESLNRTQAAYVGAGSIKNAAHKPTFDSEQSFVDAINEAFNDSDDPAAAGGV